MNDEDLLAISAAMHAPALRTIRLEVEGVPFLLSGSDPRAAAYRFLAEMYGSLARHAPEFVLINGKRWNISKRFSGFYLYT